MKEHTFKTKFKPGDIVTTTYDSITLKKVEFLIVDENHIQYKLIDNRKDYAINLTQMDNYNKLYKENQLSLVVDAITEKVEDCNE